MANFSCRTNPKYSSDPQGKPRVYFTCHPEDFDKYFDRICEDIFKTQDCAIYYTEDMTEVIPEEDMETDLERMNLFVVPVTLKLLLDPNRAMNSDIAYAKQKKLAILPFMMEPGIDIVYARPDKFGERQYLRPSSSDLTEISYEEKLKKHLESVLISKEMADKVRAAFDAYIFLSYRKKDRKYANELMRLIHKDPKYRDIAIWYDEFLTPGESFKANIEKALSQSKLFALLVTPNLLEEPDGKPNFVMDVEYPMANGKKPILPAEMEETDKVELGKKFDGIPECVDPSDDPTFKERLAESLVNIAIGENDDDPEHNVLIGLAYLDGIDVEVDRDRALALITSAAEADLPEAMLKLYDMYSEGSYVDLNYHEALKWGERLAKYCKKNLGEEDPDTLASINNLATTYTKLGNYPKALELLKTVYDLMCKVSGEKDPDTLTILSNLAYIYCEYGNNHKALELNKKAYDLQCEVLGKEHPNTLTSLANLAAIYMKQGNPQKSLELYKKVYKLSCRILSEKHPDTLNTLDNIAYAYKKLGDHKKALELNEKAYNLMCRILGEEHPDTLTSLNNLALTYANINNHNKALKLHKKSYPIMCRIMGEEHRNTLTSLNNLACTYCELDKYRDALVLFKKAYPLFCKVFGKESHESLKLLHDLSFAHYKCGDIQAAIPLLEKAYFQHRRVLGEAHRDTLSTMSNLAIVYGEAGETQKAMELFEKIAQISKKI